MLSSLLLFTDLHFNFFFDCAHLFRAFACFLLRKHRHREDMAAAKNFQKFERNILEEA